MRPRDFFLMVLICIVWAYNNVVSKIVVGSWHVPPLAFAMVRFLIVSIVTLPWLLPVPKQFGRVAVVALLMGGINFALLFAGLKTVSPSVTAVVVQAGVPFTTLLSVLMLNEHVSWRRGIGIVLTLVGILLVLWRPGAFDLGWGALFILASAFGASLGSVMMKQLDAVEPLHFQAWVGTLSFPVVGIGSVLVEHGQWQAMAAIGWPFVAALAYAALLVSVFAHTAYYGLIRRYDANLVVPLTLMNPLFTFAFGIIVTGDRFDLRMGAGALLALLGVLAIALRSKSREIALPLMAEREQS
jgi:drug/metabolite transporter (DMT)-like permease